MTMPVWLAGLIGGLIAGAVMALVVSALAPHRNYGASYLAPARLVATAFQGPYALDGGGLTVLIGGIAHFVIAGVAGGVFALLMAGFKLIQLSIAAKMGVFLGAGLIYGNMLFGLSELVLLPLIDRPLLRRLPLIDLGGVHVLFGLVLGWAVVLFT